MNFTSSPFERMMKEKPRCCCWRGIACVSCYKELLKAPAGGR